jgi:NAD(P)-dependent dehydrogenase (short-subunit alcohol dehydrogenase family)
MRRRVREAPIVERQRAGAGGSGADDGGEDLSSSAMQVSLEGKVALVTGASKGIGLAIAKSFAESGAKVMLSSRKLDQLVAGASSIDGDTHVFVANAGDVDAAEQCVAATIDRFGRLDILVNNAATNPYAGPIMEVDEGRYDKTFQVNVKGPIFWSQAAWRGWMKDNGGVIMNIASVGGLRSEGLLGIYNLTKAALIHLTRQLGGELGPKVRVVGIAPGLVKTDFSQMLVDNFGDGLARSMPTRRLGEPEDIAHLATFLASDLASWITGETYVIDGGAGVSHNRNAPPRAD